MRKKFWPNLIFNVLDPKIALPDWNSRQYVNSRLSMKIVQNVLFRQYGGRFSQISFLNVLNPKKRFTRLKFTPIRENCRLCMKIVQNVLLRPCGRRFDQITFFNVSEPKIALRDRNSRQYVKTVGFQGKLYKTCFSCNAKDVLTKSHFSTFRSQKSLYRTEIYNNTWKQ